MRITNMKIDLADYMTYENALEFIRVLFEHRDADNNVNLQLPDGTVVEMRVNPDINPPRSIDSP